METGIVGTGVGLALDTGVGPGAGLALDIGVGIGAGLVLDVAVGIGGEGEVAATVGKVPHVFIFCIRVTHHN